MRLVCMHADTVDALMRLNIRMDDLTPQGLWSSEYHLVGLTQDQLDALSIFNIGAEDVTPAQLAGAAGERKELAAEGASARAVTADQAIPALGRAAAPGGPRPSAAGRSEIPAPAADQAGREPARATGEESEVPLAQARDSSLRSEAKSEPKANGKAGQPTAPVSAPVSGPPQPQAQQQLAQKGGKGGGQPVPQAQGRKGQQGQGQVGSGQRYGTTRLRISVAGKYTEATVANGKIVVAGRSFDSPDQAAAELTKSRGDWTFWEYYDSTDGKWRMLTRDWDTVLKSAAPGGR
jgi:hypothetical protein